MAANRFRNEDEYFGGQNVLRTFENGGNPKNTSDLSRWNLKAMHFVFTIIQYIVF